MSLFKQILGESLSDDTANKLDEALESAVQAKLEEAKKEIEDKLKVQHDLELAKKDADLNEAKEAVSKATKELETTKEAAKKDKEEAEAQKKKLEESYIQSATKYVEQIKHLTEGTQAYAKAVIAEAEADKKSFQDKLLESVAKYTDEMGAKYIKENEDKFKRLEEMDKMASVFAHIKESFESHGFYLNENTKFNEQQAKIAQKEKEVSELKESLRQKDIELQSGQRKAIVESLIDGMALTDKEHILSLVEHINTDTVDDFTKLVTVIVEKQKSKAVNTNTLNEKTISTQKPEAQKPTNFVDDIASKLI